MNSIRKSLPPLSTLLPFEAASRLGSFSKAAAELHLTQAAISRQIRAIEKNLGVPLFERRNRGVFLTPEGVEFGQAVSLALEGIGASATNLRGDGRKDEVVLFSQLCEAHYWLMPRLSSFHQRHPEIDLRVVTSTRAVGDLTENIDVALQSTGRESAGYTLAFTASDDVFPVCSPAFLAGKHLPFSLRELAQQRLLHYEAESSDWMAWQDWFDKQSHGYEIGTGGPRFDNYTLMLQAALEGHGIALGWGRTVARLISQGGLVRPVADNSFLPDALSVFTRRQDNLSPQIKALVGWMKAELS